MNAHTRQGIPLRPDPDALGEHTMRSLARAAICLGQHAFEGGWTPSARTYLDIAQDRGWRDDPGTALLLRAAQNPAMTTQTNWAAELAQVGLIFLAVLRPMSAGAQLLARCLQLSFDGRAKLTLPAITGGAAQWVGEGQPIPVLRLTAAAGPSIEPHKLAAIVELTSEMVSGSDAEAMVRTALIDASAGALDASLFSSTAADALRPAGILVGATAVTASTDTIKSEAMADDLAKLAGAIAPYVGNNSIAYIASPAQAVRIAICADRLPFPVLMSSAIGSGTVIAIAMNALASVIEAVRLDAAKSVSVVEVDTSPPAIGSAGPARSAFQTDTMVIRIKLPVSWAVRDPRAVAYIPGTTW